MAKNLTIKREHKKIRRSLSASVFYGIAGAIILFILLLLLLLRFSPLNRIYLYAIAGFVSLIITYAISVRTLRRKIMGIYSSAEKISEVLESISEGNLKPEIQESEYLRELWEKLSILTQGQRERLIAVLHSLKTARENLKNSQNERAREVLDSLISNLEQDFKF